MPDKIDLNSQELKIFSKNEVAIDNDGIFNFAASEITISTPHLIKINEALTLLNDAGVFAPEIDISPDVRFFYASDEDDESDPNYEGFKETDKLQADWSEDEQIIERRVSINKYKSISGEEALMFTVTAKPKFSDGTFSAMVGQIKVADLLALLADEDESFRPGM